MTEVSDLIASPLLLVVAVIAFVLYCLIALFPFLKGIISRDTEAMKTVFRIGGTVRVVESRNRRPVWQQVR